MARLHYYSTIFKAKKHFVFLELVVINFWQFYIDESICLKLSGILKPSFFNESINATSLAE